MQSILDFIGTQSSAVVNKIYGSQDEDSVQAPWACKAVFQSLTALSKNIVMRLLFVEGAILAQQLEEWMTPDSIPIFRSSVESLMRLRILEELGDDTKRYRLNPYFRSSLRHALCRPIDPWSNTPAAASLRPDKKPPTKEELDKFSADKWEDVLRFMVNLPTMEGHSVGSIVVNFLKDTAYMKEDGKRGLAITAEGYEYMLKDRRSQIWMFALQSLSRAMNQDEALSLFFMLSYCDFGQYYALDALTKAQRQLIFEFSQLGLVYMRSVTTTRFYPTRAAINMLFKGASANDDLVAGGGGVASSSSSSSSSSIESFASRSSSSSLEIIVETNMQVVAYCDSDLHLAMLKLFVEIEIRMPNMAMGKITREKSKEAFRMGITSNQIIAFLCAHAHPLVRTPGRESIIPENVTDRLKLWETEGMRITSQPSYLIDLGNVPGMNPVIFGEVVTYTRRLCLHLWDNAFTMELAVRDSEESLQALQSYLADRLNRR